MKSQEIEPIIKFNFFECEIYTFYFFVKKIVNTESTNYLRDHDDKYTMTMGKYSSWNDGRFLIDYNHFSCSNLTLMY